MQKDSFSRKRAVQLKLGFNLCTCVGEKKTEGTTWKIFIANVKNKMLFCNSLNLAIYNSSKRTADFGTTLRFENSKNLKKDWKLLYWKLCSFSSNSFFHWCYVTGFCHDQHPIRCFLRRESCYDSAGWLAGYQSFINFVHEECPYTCRNC